MEHEPLDYCRIKKIFEKGFGFLTSLYYPENVFFHFSKIRDEDAREKLEKLKRGDVYVYFTSELKEGRRRVKQLWLTPGKADARLIQKFIKRITEEFVSGRINPYELARVVRDLRKDNLLTNEKTKAIVSAPRFLHYPELITFILTDDEKNNTDDLKTAEMIEKFENGQISESEFTKFELSLLGI